jgi:hypothetical protein
MSEQETVSRLSRLAKTDVLAALAFSLWRTGQPLTECLISAIENNALIQETRVRKEMSRQTIPPSSRSPHTWEARAEVQPIVHLGTKEDCEAWMRTVGGKDVFVMGDHSKAVFVGIVMRTSARSLT